MNVIRMLVIAALFLSACSNETASEAAEPAATEPAATATLETAQSFLEAAGSGDGDTLNKLMADDFVWHNEGDATISWIGTWKGKEVVFGQFMPAFGAGLSVTSWTTDYRFVSGDQAVFIGSMSANTNNTGENTGVFSWAVRVHVIDGKVKSWNWFEDSFAVSQAYHANAAEN